ncbi:MAG TPA: DPP IV N-terminal domain-containing protein [Bryobacteraceae bacterium]|jgi:dipeptidyl aminopeptidase/acylaminoacyl peptidase|nr:DPP IV N-terminal domain-containing protein [Bryobacteraceae bacterium]
MPNSHRRLPLLIVPLALVALDSAAQPPSALTAADYARAEKFMGYNADPLVYHAVHPTWTTGELLWYRDTGTEGVRFVLFDPAKLTKEPAFDHGRLAAALSAAAGKKYEANKLPFNAIELSADGASSSFGVSFSAGGRRFRCDRQGSQCAVEQGGTAASARFRTDAPSPDKQKTAFIREYNLWVRDLATGKETQLTNDGVKDYSYALDNAGWVKSDRAILVWSPDSKKIATFQQDQRNVGEMYLVETRVGHPVLHAWKYPLPGDETVATIRRVIVDVEGQRVIPLQMPPDQHRSTLCDHVVCRGSQWEDVGWSPDSSQLAFVSTSRDHKQERLRTANAADGAVRDVMEESVATQYESGQGMVNWRYLPASNEVIWYSERSNWGHLYLYDLATGKLKNPITSGDFVVTELLRVDEKARTLYFLADGREQGRDPYFQHLYRVGFDGNGLTLLTPEDANHEVTFSPSGRYFVDNYSKPDAPPVSVLRDAEGKLLATIEKADISKLEAAGWKPPEPIVVKARDGVTDLYGLLFKPTNFDPRKKYPIVNHIYPGPQGGSVGGRSFTAARGDAQALAELGFIVVTIDGMGNPQRSKSFHDAYYGNMGDNTLPDQVAGMQQLARRFPWIDIERAGIWGHSGGGYAAADAMFRYPDFFKVGISEAGNHDNREYEDDWGERYQGLLSKAGSGTNYDDQANQNLAKNLKGHLLLAHGTMDDNVPPYNTLLVVNELIKANKDFDLLLLPNRHHGFGNEPYMVRRRWDYFVRYLMGAEPPKEYELRTPANAMGGAPE